MRDVLSVLDGAAIVGVLLAVLIAGYVGARRRQDGTSTFILAGRTLTLPVFVASLVATWYGSVLGATEFVISYGLAFVLCFGVPYYVIALAYAQWLAKRIRQSEAVSIPDQFRIVYGDRAARFVACLMLIITIPASYQLSLALITQSFTGWSLEASLLATSVFAFVYVAKGGLRSDAYANIVQSIVMFAGYIACLVACVTVVGSPSWLIAQTPRELLDLPGPLGWTPIVVWFVIALQTFIDPNFHVRTAAARDAGIARRGIAYSVGAWIIFDTLQLFVGLYALHVMGKGHGAQSALHLGMHVLPDVWRGVFVAGIVAAVMSALDGYALVSGTIIGHDLRSGGEADSAPTRLRIGVVIALVIGGIVAYLLPSVIGILYRAASITVPAVLAPLLLSYTPYASRIRSHVIMLLIVPALASIAVMIAQETGIVSHPLAEPMLIGIVVSLCVLILSLRTHDRHPTA